MGLQLHAATQLFHACRCLSGLAAQRRHRGCGHVSGSGRLDCADRSELLSSCDIAQFLLVALAGCEQRIVAGAHGIELGTVERGFLTGSLDLSSEPAQQGRLIPCAGAKGYG